MSKTIQRGVKALETVYDFYKGRVNRATKAKIKNIIGLYDDRKIAQFTTTDKLIRNFINANTDQQKQKASDQYNKVYDKHKEKKPLGERMQTAKRDNKLTEIRRRLTQKTAVQRIQKRVRAEQSKETHAYSVDLMFFKFKPPKDTIKASFKDSKGRPLIPIWYETKTATIQTTDYIEDLSGRRVFQYETKDRYVFKKLLKTIMSDPDMEDTLRFVHSYIVCIKVKDVDRVDGATDFIPVDENLTDFSHVSMFHRYIQTPLNPAYETLKEAIKVNHYQENQCWLNTITEYYKDTLMGEKRREKNRLTRQSMLTLIGKSEEDFKTSGASIKEMVKVFEHYRIQVRIYNAFERLFFQYDPPKRDHHIPALYAIVKNNHIYTATDTLNALRQMLPRRSGYDISVKASPDYHLNEKDEPVQCKMIQSLSDIKKYNEHVEYTLIYDGHDLAELFYESKKAGYEPQVKFSAGIVSELNFKFRIKKNVIKYKIKTQNLVNNSIDGTISVRTEQIYNNMSRAMYVFNKSLFNPLHKSYYNEIDMELFKECRTINPVGEINRHYFQYNPHTNKDDKMFYMPEHAVEIDIRKAFIKHSHML